jgi:hypothetical protein
LKHQKSILTKDEKEEVLAMSEKPRQKFFTSRTLEHRFDGSPYFKTVTFVEEFDTLERIWIKRRDLDVTIEQTPSEIGLFKEKEILVAFPRTATDMRTLKTLSAWFVQKLKVSVDQGKAFRHVWLSLTNGKIFVQWLGFNGRYSGLTTQANLDGTESCLVVQKVGKPRRISRERLDAMVRAQEISMTFASEKFGEISLAPKQEG